MISFRKYLSILTMMAVLLFMFMFTQVAKETISNYATNTFAEKEAVSGSARWRPLSAGEGSAVPLEDGQFILFLGSLDSGVGRIVSQWCLYTKRELAVCERLEDFLPETQGRPEMILLDSAAVDYRRDTGRLADLAEEGMHMVFCNLPDVSVIRAQRQLRELLGIQYVRADLVEVEGIHLFEDFFLGGSYMYRVSREEDRKRQDLQLEIPWYVTLTGTKTYMVGMLDEMLENDTAKNENVPGIIWRNSYGDAKIFAVNGGYMSDMTGIGILSAMAYELAPYDVYPVLNAQNLLMIDYPGFAEENAEELQRIYSRTPRAVQQDIIWPTLMSVLRRGEWKLTAFIAPQYDYRDDIEPDGENLTFYLQQFREAGAEAGVSLQHGESADLPEKISRDEAFYRSTGYDYAYSAAYADPLEFREVTIEAAAFTAGIRTVACEYNPETPLVFYYDDRITGQSIIGDARTHTYSENLRLRSLETALGYSNVKIDVHEVMWPQSDETHWEKLYEEVSSNLDTWWRPFTVFDRTTLTESDGRLRTLMNLDYAHHREGDWVSLEVEGTEEDSWFILRTHGEEIAGIQGAEYQTIERDAYLLHVLGDRAEVRLAKNRGVLIYNLPDRH